MSEIVDAIGKKMGLRNPEEFSLRYNEEDQPPKEESGKDKKKKKDKEKKKPLPRGNLTFTSLSFIKYWQKVTCSFSYLCFWRR